MLTEDSARLEKIDSLYNLRLDQYVSLPMLVVVGDQSSGKSSVLEGLTQIPFLRDSSLCTRFPMQVVFKRSQSTRTEISIIPASSPETGKNRQTGTFRSWTPNHLDESEMLRILTEACKCMAVLAPGQLSNGDLKSFSHDVLKIELSGPHYEHFSVVDLPGLFRNPTPGKTTKEDTVFVKDMVASYIENPRSIILVVVPANVDIATQEIVQMAQDADKGGVRTLGVLTKPDLVDKGAENDVMKLLQGKDGNFGLGYTVVCNRSQSKLEMTIEDRNKSELNFFKEKPWNAVSKDRTGIKALDTRLKHLLVELARSNFREVGLDVDLRMEECEAQLSAMGPERSSKTDQQNHLVRIATQFQCLTSHALDAYYGRDPCFSNNDTLRLATTVKCLQENFSLIMRREGHTRTHGCPLSPLESQEGKEEQEGEEKDQEEDDDGDDVSSDASYANDSSDGEDLGAYVSVSTSSLLIEHRKSLFRILDKPIKPTNKPEEDITTWIRREYNRSKGFEIGTINPSLLPALYHEQTKYWRFYALDHMNQVIEATHSFIFSLLGHLCLEPATLEQLWAKLNPKIISSYGKPLQHMELLLKIEENGNLRTLNHYFAQTLKKRRASRIQKRLGKCKSWTTTESEKEPLLRLTDVLDNTMSNEDQTVEDLLDMLQSYYKVARKQFVDAVTKEAVDYLLLTVEDGPLSVCSPEFVISLSETELAQIAGESPESSSRRAAIGRELETLKEARIVLEM